jgi:hypothetical protein
MPSVNANPPILGMVFDDGQLRQLDQPQSFAVLISLTPAALSASVGFQEQTFTVTGLLAGDIVFVNPPAAPATNTDLTRVRVSAANTLALTFFNATAAANTPIAGVYRLVVFRN